MSLSHILRWSDSSSSFVCLSVLGGIEGSWITIQISKVVGHEYHTPSLLSSISVESVKKRETGSDSQARLIRCLPDVAVSAGHSNPAPAGQMCDHSFPLNCVGVKSHQVASVSCLFWQHI